MRRHQILSAISVSQPKIRVPLPKGGMALLSTLPEHPVMSSCPCVGTSNYSAMLVLLSSRLITNPEKKTVWVTPTDNQLPVLPVYQSARIKSHEQRKAQESTEQRFSHKVSLNQ